MSTHIELDNRMRKEFPHKFTAPTKGDTGPSLLLSPRPHGRSQLEAQNGQADSIADVDSKQLGCSARRVR